VHREKTIADKLDSFRSGLYRKLEVGTKHLKVNGMLPHQSGNGGSSVVGHSVGLAGFLFLL